MLHTEIVSSIKNHKRYGNLSAFKEGFDPDSFYMNRDLLLSDPVPQDIKQYWEKNLFVLPSLDTIFGIIIDSEEEPCRLYLACKQDPDLSKINILVFTEQLSGDRDFTQHAIELEHMCNTNQFSWTTINKTGYQIGEGGIPNKEFVDKEANYCINLLLRCCALMNTRKTISVTKSVNKKDFKNHRKSGRKPDKKFTEIRLTRYAKERKSPQNKVEVSPHHRRGHYRKYKNGKIVFVKSCIVRKDKATEEIKPTKVYKVRK